MSVVSELNDNCFSLATDLMVELCREVEAETGSKPTIADLCELLTWGLRSCSQDILDDVNTCNVVALLPKVLKHSKVIPKPGDLVAIPAGDSNSYFAVYITKNGFGHALGLLKGKRKSRPLRPDWTPEIAPHPIYTGIRFLANGQWQIVGNYPRLLKLFPSKPEIYHPKTALPEDEEVGPYGSAESPGGKLRRITKAEAEEIGLLSGEYRQGIPEEQVRAFCDRHLKGHSRR